VFLQNPRGLHSFLIDVALHLLGCDPGCQVIVTLTVSSILLGNLCLQKCQGGIRSTQLDIADTCTGREDSHQQLLKYAGNP